MVFHCKGKREQGIFFKPYKHDTMISCIKQHRRSIESDCLMANWQLKKIPLFDGFY